MPAVVVIGADSCVRASCHPTADGPNRSADLRDALRVRPGKRVDLAKVDPAATFGYTKEDAAAELAAGARAADRPPGPALGRGQAQGPRRPPGHRRGRQGRHDPARDDARSTRRAARDVVQGADARGARPRLPVAHPPARARQGRDRRSSTARTTRTCSSSASTSSCREEVWSARYDQINDVRAAARRRRARRSSSSSCTSTRTSSAQRFQERLDDPTKRWKFSLGDLEERKRWDDYIAAYEDALERCSTDVRAVVRHPGQPQLVPQPRGRDDPGDTLDDLKPAYPARAGPRRGPRHRVSVARAPLAAAEQRAEDAADDVLPGRARSATLPPVRIACSIGAAWPGARRVPRARRPPAAGGLRRSRSAAFCAAAISRAWRWISRCCWAGVIVFSPPAVVGGTPARIACRLAAWAAAARARGEPRGDDLVGALAVDRRRRTSRCRRLAATRAAKSAGGERRHQRVRAAAAASRRAASGRRAATARSPAPRRCRAT